MARFDSEGTSPFFKTYASISADVDLVADGGGPARYFRIGGAGDLALTLPDGVSTDTVPSIAAGENILGGAVTILAATTATNITAFW